MLHFATRTVVCLAAMLFLAAPSLGATIDMTGKIFDRRSSVDLTSVDVNGDGINTDWRAWDGSTLPGVFDEKAGASNIGDVTINGITSAQEEWWDHTWTAVDAESGMGQNDIRTGVKITKSSDMLDITGSVSDIGGAGTLFVYTGGWQENIMLDFTIGSDSQSLWIDTEIKGAVLFQVDYSGVTDPAATIDYKVWGTKKKDVKWNAVLLDVTAPVPEPMSLALLAIGSFSLLRRR